MSRESYNTEQASLVLSTIKAYEGNFTIKDLEEELEQKVGPATIYRQIKKLCDEGKVKKQLIEGNNYYCYVGDCSEKNHFNLLCKDCGRITHVDCECLKSFCEQIKREHNFEIDNNKLIITGYCDECQEK